MLARRKVTTSDAMPWAVTKLARRASQRNTILTPGYSSCRFLASVEESTISPMNLVWRIRIEWKGLGEICNMCFSAPGGLGGRKIGQKRCRDCVLRRTHQREFAYKIVSLAPNGHRTGDRFFNAELIMSKSGCSGALFGARHRCFGNLHRRLCCRQPCDRHAVR